MNLRTAKFKLRKVSTPAIIKEMYDAIPRYRS